MKRALTQLLFVEMGGRKLWKIDVTNFEVLKQIPVWWFEIHTYFLSPTEVPDLIQTLKKMIDKSA